MSERIVKLLIESFPKILLPGLQMTIPLTVIAFSIAMEKAITVSGMVICRPGSRIFGKDSISSLTMRSLMVCLKFLPYPTVGSGRAALSRKNDGTVQIRQYP